MEDLRKINLGLRGWAAFFTSVNDFDDSSLDHVNCRSPPSGIPY
jgi:hypothetical protein